MVKIPSSSDPDIEYKVYRPLLNCEPDELICQCLGFLHRGKCRHQREASAIICDWNSKDGPEIQTEKGICPRCGEDTIEDMEFE